MFQRNSIFTDLRNLTLVMVLIYLVPNAADAACNRDNLRRRNSGMSETVILDSDRGKTFDLSVGSSIAIRLAENPTTGYRWEISKVDNQLVEFQCSDYLKTPGVAMGGGGIRTFYLRAKSTGTSQIELKLRRSWEPEARTSDQFTITILIS